MENLKLFRQIFKKHLQLDHIFQEHPVVSPKVLKSRQDNHQSDETLNQVGGGWTGQPPSYETAHQVGSRYQGCPLTSLLFSEVKTIHSYLTLQGHEHLQ